MPTNIFSTYTTDENRVTASVLAVLRSLSIDRTERLLAALLERPELELVRFQNQPSKGGESVPDGIVRASCCILIETKIKPNNIRLSQLKHHLGRLEQAPEAMRVLLVLTPDHRQPAVLSQLDNPLVAWSSFAALDQAIEELLGDPHEVISEREAFLLRELQAMLLSEGLVATSHEVVVVAARHAWPEYERYYAYVCQADRPFQPVRRIAFYASGKIWPLVPRIVDVHEHVEFAARRYRHRLGELVDRLLADHVRTDGEAYKVMLLSPPESDETIKLDAPVINDLTSESGRPTAFTQGQRYVVLDRLLSAKTTSDVVGG